MPRRGELRWKIGLARAAIVAVFLLAVTGCALLPPRAKVPAGPRALDAASPAERREYLRRAQVWQPVRTASLELLSGPPGEGAFSFEQDVTCDFATKPRPGGGTPKFYCTVAPGDTVKVKYGKDNPEVYGEVAGTRLFWALGFAADRQYPVRVTCRNCPADPWRQPTPDPGAVRIFDPAIIEREPVGTPIEVMGRHKGWEWWELQLVDERAGGASRAQIDALRLLAAFVQHSDNKDEQQRLICLPGSVHREATGQETCTEARLYTVDLGATFSRAQIRNANKFEFHHWSTVPVWRDRERCIAKLKQSLTASFGNPRISEAGRTFLASRLMELSDSQIRDLFVAARAERVGELIEEHDGRTRPVTTEDWVQAFLRKRREIVEHRCPE